MRRKVQSVVLSLFASTILCAPLQAEEADEIQARCEAEAKEAGITDTDEKAEYIAECVAELSQSDSGSSSNN
ncbi:MAG: hypothetical protein P8103_02885 [Candidatus Thiodiazotropha sp.]